ncbi:MAG TPA: methyltransferase domain-containing protein [Pseudonocardiaceae bacterium]|mgnify:CR=1 FL=1
MVRLLDPFFAHPRGLPGRIGGALMARSNAAVEQHTVALAAVRPGETVLVVGPGPGVGLRAAAEAATGGRAVGVEPSETMRDLARQHCADLIRTGRVELRDGSAEATGQPDGSVDVVITVNNVQFWPDRPTGFGELCRVLRPGGRLVLSTHRSGLELAGITVSRLRTEVEQAGLTDIVTSEWEHGGRMGPAVQLTARRPA